MGNIYTTQTTSNKKTSNTSNTKKTHVLKTNKNQETDKLNLNGYIEYCKSEKGKKEFSHIKNLDEQVDAIEKFKNGKMTYSEMRALAG